MILYQINFSDRHYARRHKNGWRWRWGRRAGAMRAGCWLVPFELCLLAWAFAFGPAFLIPLYE